MNLFETIICVWLLFGGIIGYGISVYPKIFRTCVWVCYILCTPFVPFVSYIICDIVR
jgi:hypothetical protein